MPYRMPEGTDLAKLPPVRWRRGLIVDVDTQYRKLIEKLGGEEVSREDAAEVLVEPGAAAVPLAEPIESDEGPKAKRRHG